MRTLRFLHSLLFLALTLTALLLLAPMSARAQLANALYVSTTSGSTATIRAYDATSGLQITTFDLSFTGNPQGMALSGNTLFVVEPRRNRISSFNATTGDLLNATFITGLADPRSLTILGNNLYVTTLDNGSVAKYRTDGTLVDSSFVAKLGTPGGVTAFGNSLYVADSATDAIRIYNANTGDPSRLDSITSGINNPFGLTHSTTALYVANNGNDTVTAYSSSTGDPLAGFSAPNSGSGLDGPSGLAFSGNTLFVTDAGNRVRTYNATTGALLNNSFLTLTSSPNSILVTAPAAAMPDPPSLALLAIGALPLIGRAGRRKKAPSA